MTDELLVALEAAGALATASTQDTPSFRTFSLPDAASSATVSVKETALFTDVGLTTWGAAFYLAECVMPIIAHTRLSVTTCRSDTCCHSQRCFRDRPL